MKIWIKLVKQLTAFITALKELTPYHCATLAWVVGCPSFVIMLALVL